MQILRTVKEIREWKASIRGSVGFVPTMGALHDGHLSLVSQSLTQCDHTVVSIFVNPTQFGPNMDLDTYPRDLEGDIEKLKSLHEVGEVDIVFAPSLIEIYPHKQASWIEVESVTEHLDGASRPGYFRGIATVVAKLFNIVRPDSAFFGQKDIQQATMITKMAIELNLGVDVVTVPTVREADGLAMSSRNQYLTDENRSDALLLFQALSEVEQRFQAGQSSCAMLKKIAIEILQRSDRIKIDYVEIVDRDSMQPIDIVESVGVIAIAVDLEGTRLIDNFILQS